jgi:hypothetical protein
MNSTDLFFSFANNSTTTTTEQVKQYYTQENQKLQVNNRKQ